MGSPVAVGSFAPTIRSESSVPRARCRIDRWCAGAWQPVSEHFTQEEASAALALLQQQEPDAWFRIVRRNDVDVDAAPDAMPSPDALLRAPGPVLVADRDRPAGGWRGNRRSDDRRGSAAARAAGFACLAGLCALVAAASWLGPAAVEPVSRSALAPGGAEAGATAAGSLPVLPAWEVPAILADVWSEGADCTGTGVRFLPDAVLQTDTSGTLSAFAVAGYHREPGDAVRVAHAGGASITYQRSGDRLLLQRARIAGIEITPQRPVALVRCADGEMLPAAAAATEAGPLPNTPQTAFRLAVEAHDDLAATLAIARGLPVAAPLPAAGNPLPMEWAVRHGRAVLIGKLAAAGADPDAPAVDGWPLLSLAVRNGDVAVVEALLEAGADPEVRDADGLTPLQRAGAMNHQLLIDVLFAAGR